MTDEEKQFEEMSEDIKEILVRNFDKTNLYHWVTKDLYNKGYRKASDVAREIFAEIYSSLDYIEEQMEPEEIPECFFSVREDIDALKVKFESGGTADEI